MIVVAWVESAAYGANLETESSPAQKTLLDEHSREGGLACCFCGVGLWGGDCCLWHSSAEGLTAPVNEVRTSRGCRHVGGDLHNWQGLLLIAAKSFELSDDLTPAGLARFRALCTVGVSSLLLCRLLKAYTWSATVLVDELHTGRFARLGRRLINAQPQPNRRKVNEGKIVRGEPVVAGCHPTTLFDPIEEPRGPSSDTTVRC
jgi:hypothetical protein